MIVLKTQKQVDQIKHNGIILREAVNRAAALTHPGTTTAILNKIIEEYITQNQATPTFKGYGGTAFRKSFPSAACISVNDVLVHGIPGKLKIQEGDLVSIDIGVTKEGCIADSCYSYIVGKPKPEHQELLEAAKEITMYGISLVQPDIRVHDLARAIAIKAEALGFMTMPDLYGHGTGIQLHEKPSIPFTKPPYKEPMPNPKLKKDMVITIEPVVCFQSNAGNYVEDKDGWTLRTLDGTWAAQFEHTLLLTEDGNEILTGEFLR